MSQRNPQKNTNLYSHVYEILESEGIIGKIAYCFYKEAKRDYIRSYKNRVGKNPTQKEIEKFVQLQQEQHIEHFKRDAKDIVNVFFNQLLEDHKKDLKIQALREANKPGFWSGIIQNLIASLIWTLLIAIFLPLIIQMADIDLVDILRNRKKTDNDTNQVISSQLSDTLRIKSKSKLR